MYRADNGMEYKTAYPDRYLFLRAFARENRKNMTLRKACFGKNSVGNLGHKFLRQHIIGDYIVDFLCRDKGLISKLMAVIIQSDST